MKLYKIFLVASLLFLSACGTYHNSGYHDYDYDYNTHHNHGYNTYCCSDYDTHYGSYDKKHRGYYDNKHRGSYDKKHSGSIHHKYNSGHKKEKTQYVPRSTSNSLKIFHKKPEKHKINPNDKKYNKHE